MIEPIKENVYDWDTLEQYFCDKMGINPVYFRHYHNKVGGDYKDFWHVWLSINYNEIETNKITKYWFPDDYDEVYNELLEEYGEWVKPLVDAISSLHEEMGTDNILIRYCW